MAEVNHEILRLEIDAAPSEQGARRYARSIDEVRAASGKAEDASRGLEQRFRDLAKGAAGAGALIADRLTNGLTGLSRIAKGVATQFVDLTSVGLLGLSRGLRAVAEGTRDANGELSAMGKVANVSATGMEKLGRAVEWVGRILFGLKLAAGAAAVSVGVLAHRAASEFAPAWNRVRTLLGGEPFRELRSEVSDLAGDLGVDGTEAARTFYEVLSAMPQLARQPTQALDVLQASLSAASTGFADATEAASAITGILNAFNLEASEATRVSDALFAAQDLGVTTFGEVAASIGTVADLTASLGGRFEDLLAILASTTDSGVDTATRFTQLRSVISAIIKPTAEAEKAVADLDVDLSAAALSSQGLSNYLLRLIEATNGNPDVLAKVFPQESLGLVLALARQTDVLREKTEQIGAAAGKTQRNVATMNDSWARQKEILGDQLSDILRQIGFQFESIGASGLKAANTWLQNWRDMRKELRGAREDLLALAEAQARLVNGGQPFTLPPTVVTPSGSRRSDPITRPAEPIGFEYSADKIRAFQDSQLAAANMALAQTGDMAAYERAVSGAKRAVNDLVAAEIARNRAAGVEQRDLDRLALLYEVVREKAEAFRKTVENIGQVLRAQGLASPGGIGLSPEQTIAEGRNMGMVLEPIRPVTVDTKALMEALNPRTDFRKVAEGFADGARGLVDLADAAGLLGDTSRRALSGLSGLIGSLSSLKGQSGLGLVGGILGVAGAGASLLAGLFSKEDPARDAMVRALEANREELDRLRRTMQGIRPTFDTMGNVVETLSLLENYEGDGGRGGARTLTQAMALAGLTRDQLAVTASAFNIDVFDENGDIIIDAFRQLAEAVEMARLNVVEFGKTLDGQRKLTDAFNEVFDVTDPAALLQSQVELLAKQSPGLFGGMAGLDFSSAGDRALLEAALRDLVTRAMSGGLSADELGGFTSVEEFLESILGIDRALDGFAEATNAATSAMLNVPRALPLELIRQGVYAGIAGGMGPGGATDLGGNLPPNYGPMASRSSAGVHFTGGLTIVNEAGDSPEALVKKIETGVQQRAASGQYTYLPNTRTDR